MTPNKKKKVHSKKYKMKKKSIISSVIITEDFKILKYCVFLKIH